jgi:hypothetical protein
MCVVCGDPAYSRCSGCKSDSYVHHYCGEACQTKDWPTHKKVCEDLQNFHLEKLLARIADIVQQAFYNFRERTNVHPIVRVQDRGDSVVIYHGEPTGAPKLFRNFPRHLINDERVRDSVLCSDGCSAAAAWMYGLLARLLEGIPPRLSSLCNMLMPYPGSNFFVHKVGFTMTRIPRKNTVYNHKGNFNHDWPGITHTVNKVTSTRTEKEWYLDFSGAQFGIYRKLWGCTEYKTAHKAIEVEGHAPSPFDTCKAILQNLGKMPGQNSFFPGAVGQVADHLNTTAVGWATGRGIVVSRMLALHDGNFDRLKVELLATMQGEVRKFVRANNFAAEFEAAFRYERQRLGLGT